MTLTDEIAIAALVSNDRLLLAHRHPARRWYPNCWDLVGGHVEPGESPADAVRRECREEIAVEITAWVPVDVHLDAPDLLAHAFLVTQWTGQPMNAAPEEHDQLGWFSSGEISTLLLAHPSYVEWLPNLILNGRSARRRSRH